MTQHSEKKSKTPKGKPAGTSRDTAGPIEVDSGKMNATKKIENKYLDEHGEPADNVDMKNVNRNTDKEMSDLNYNHISRSNNATYREQAFR
ncbi:hypothetical protein [Sphingobacterium haloxyli]|uniref:Uncharacterized protein n=1 Tax=Sphingobacterium haloxyli TaxID=2100533 RepID=A0A2S9IWT7_9SPHI|nr:hypothetical protein [Sphingobacterium haloxyli]PRD44993.1 hypothetical protein C5745_18675 [Sphingobacterium haloxyli]